MIRLLRALAALLFLALAAAAGFALGGALGDHLAAADALLDGLARLRA